VDATGLAGRAYKAAEDRLDAVFCAYLGALALDGRLEMVGRPEEGSIVVPRQGASRSRIQPPAARR
jgi:predicted RNase H-like nuclease